MEKFMFLFRGEDTHLQTADYNLKEVQEYIQLWISWQQDLAQKGILIGGDPLKSSGKQVKGKSKVVMDSSFTSAQYTVDGYLIIHANNLDHATEIAKECPLLTKESGQVEIRPIQAQN
jgi:hypothetical protein